MHRALQEIRVESGDTIIVGLSGGVDSLALAILSSQVASTLNLRVVAGHYDHGIRSLASRKKECKIVEVQTSKLGLLLQRECAVTNFFKTRQKKCGESLEHIARQYRYAFLFKLAKCYRARGILVAHHMDDNIETAFMRFLEGSKNIFGIPYRNGIVIRPFININRTELRKFVKSSGLPVFDDPSNKDEKILRNRIRNLIPIIKSTVPSAWGKFSLSDNFREKVIENFEAEVSSKLSWTYFVDNKNGSYYRVSGVVFWATDKTVRVSTLYRGFNAVLGSSLYGRYNRPRINSSFFSPLLKDIPLTDGFIEGHGVRIDYSRVYVRIKRLFKKENSTLGTVVQQSQRRYLLTIRNAPTNNKEHYINKNFPWQVTVAKVENVLEGDVIIGNRFPITIRSVIQGDIILTGLGHKKVTKFYSEWKIPINNRCLIPIVLDSKGVYAIAGSAMDLPIIYRNAGNRKDNGDMHSLDIGNTKLVYVLRFRVGL